MTKYILMVFAGACSYGMLSTFVKLANQEGYKAAAISLTQAIVGMTVLWTVVILRGRNRSTTDKTVQFWPVVFTGVAIGLTTFVYYLSVQYISASLAVVLLMQFAWIGVLLNWWLFKQKPEVAQFIAIVFIMAGTVMASGVTSASNFKISTKGILYALASAILYAVYIVANSTVAKKMDSVKKSAVIMSGSAAGIFIVNSHELTSATLIDLNLFKWASFLALFGTVIPPVLFATGIPKIGAGISAVIMTVELPVAVIFAHFILGEQLDLMQCVGIGIMLLALILLNAQKIDWFRKKMRQWVHTGPHKK